MAKQRLSLLDKYVHTQYGDMKGVISIDGHNGVSELYELCEKNNIKRKDYFLIGFGFEEDTLDGVDSYDSIMCYVLLLDKKNYPSTYDELEKLFTHNPKADVIKKSFEVKYSELYKYIKRIEALMMIDLGDKIKEMNII